MTDRATVAGVVLAGGQSRRMGSPDKFLQPFGGGTLLQCVIERLRPQVAELLISANGDPARVSAFGAVVLPDSIPGFAGPLAGVLAALEWLALHAPRVTHLASAPSDTPWLPTDLVARLGAALRRDAADIAVAASAERDHPVCALWPVSIADALRLHLVTGNSRSLRAFQHRFRVTVESWPVAPLDPFFNVNTPEDLRVARRIAEEHRAI